MRHRVLKLVSALAGCVPVLALAQQPPAPEPAPGPRRNWTRELTLGAGGTYLDQQLIGQVKITDPSASRIAWGGVLSVGVNLGQMWNLSIGTFAGYTKPATVIQPFAALGWTPNINWGVSPFLSVGAGVTNVRWRSYQVTSRYAAHVGGGIRMMLGDRIALRLEAREQYEKYRDSTAFPNAVFNGTGSLGLSWFIGGASRRDSDGDGVADNLDRCPDTPQGASVDAQGCPSDSDNDGVPDGLDRCPNTPEGVTVDAQGCPADSDGDGVPDYLDKCPDTPSGARVDTIGDRAGCAADSDGDGVPDVQDRCPNTPPTARPVDANGCPVDSDSDGVPDYRDRCPNTPAAARPVDANGCPVDSDSDGVPDYRDRCPGTPPNTRVDADGCPVGAAAPRPSPVEVAGGRAYPLPEVNASRPLRNVTFRGQAVLTPAARSELNLVADAIMATPGSRWEVGSYWDSRGAAARVLRMTQLRAAAVRAYLVARGVPSASVIAIGYGSRNPVADNTTVRGRAQNRRVEIKRLR